MTIEDQIKNIIAESIKGCLYRYKIKEDKGLKITIFTDNPKKIIGKRGQEINKLANKINSSFGQTKIQVKDLFYWTNIFIYHKEEYFIKALASSLGYEDIQLFKESQTLITNLKEHPTHIIICEYRVEQLSLILKNVLIKCEKLPIILLLTFAGKDSLIKLLKTEFPEIEECFNELIFHLCQLPNSLNEIKQKLNYVSNIPKNKENQIRRKIAKRLAEQCCPK